MAQLEVTVVEARNLSKKDTLSENDPFVKIYLDNKDLSQKTKTKSNAKNPQWNQTFFFNHFVGQDILHVTVYDEDSVRNDKIGATEIDLRPLYEKGFIDDWFDLKGKLNLRSHGEIHLVLRYDRLKV